MRKILFLFSIITLILSCNNGKGKNKIQKNSISSSRYCVNDSLSKDVSRKDMDALKILNNANVKSEILRDKNITIDTIIGDYHISYSIKDNDDIIIQKRICGVTGNPDTVYHADRSVYLEIKNKEKIILQKKEINKQSFKIFINDDYIDKYLLQSFEIYQVKNSSIIFSFFICMPDSDMCYLFYIHINDFGVSSVEWVDEGEMGE